MEVFHEKRLRRALAEPAETGGTRQQNAVCFYLLSLSIRQDVLSAFFVFFLHGYDILKNMDYGKYEKLSILRQELATKHQLELYMVWSNETQSLLAASDITKTEDLTSIKGIGPRKAELFGPEIIAVLLGKPRKNEQVHDRTPEYFGEGEKILTVALYLDYLNVILQSAESVKVFGEIFSINHHQTGVYLTIKDPVDPAVLDCYINPYTYKGIGIPLEVGMQVKISGTPQIFKRRGSFRLQIEGIELAGEGSIKKAYDLLKAKLEAEGLFARKREIPEFITSVGIITSATGAVIDDFRKNIINRGLKLTLADVRVEGRSAPEQITVAIKNFNKIKNPPDVLVVMRGGGSLEDLQAFNQEAVVRTLFSSRIPVIAAIGHDRDVPLSCLAADNYTSTPTAAAVAINNSWHQLDYKLPLLEYALYTKLNARITQNLQQLNDLQYTLNIRLRGIMAIVNEAEQSVLQAANTLNLWLQRSRERIVLVSQNITRQLHDAIVQVYQRIEFAKKDFELNDPNRQLALGYSIMRTPEGKIVKSIQDVTLGQTIKADLHDGSLDTTVIRKRNYEKG